jgi:hypothetical protein
MLLTMLLLIMLPLRAAEITATITGVLTGGWDQLGIFATGTEAKNMSGKPFTLVFTFDDARGNPQADKGSSGLSGTSPQSPGKAVLTLGDGSFIFGGEKFSTWSVYRSPTYMQIVVNERKGSLFNFAPEVDVRIMPASGSRSSFGTDWKAPLSRSDIDNQASCFFIAQRDKPSREAKGCFDVKKLDITKR